MPPCPRATTQLQIQCPLLLCLRHQSPLARPRWDHDRHACNHFRSFSLLAETAMFHLKASTVAVHSALSHVLRSFPLTCRHQRQRESSIGQGKSPVTPFLSLFIVPLTDRPLPCPLLLSPPSLSASPPPLSPNTSRTFVGVVVLCRSHHQFTVTSLSLSPS